MGLRVFRRGIIFFFKTALYKHQKINLLIKTPISLKSLLNIHGDLFFNRDRIFRYAAIIRV